MKRGYWLAIGIVVGVGLGFLIGWKFWPIKYYDTAPAALRADYKGEYVHLVALAYASEGDLNHARLRLARLNSQDPVAPLVMLTESLIAKEAPVADIIPLAQLARDLGAATPLMAPYLGGAP
ncbi:MAG: hypothetical protein DRI37_08955 [Chloroflexi bacterium]|nr:MAG: hypothetical protein DRI37_08955 [Chloroflexota bacterium]